MAVTFTGSSYLSIASVPASQTIKSSPLTISIWAYCTGSGGSVVVSGGDVGMYVGIVGSGTSGSSFTDSAYVGNSLSVGSTFFDLNQVSFAEEIFVEIATTVVNTWHHWAATWDGTLFKIYKDGVLTTPVSSGGSLTSSVAWNRVIVGGFNGDAQDAWVFNRVLTANEITALYQGRTNRVGTANIVGHWPLFADRPGLDISGQGRSLTATGSVVAATRNAPVAFGGPGSQIALRTLAVSTGTPITAAGQTASSATAAVSFAQNLPINATASTASSASASVSVTQAITAAATTASTGAAAMLANLPVNAAATTASSATASVGLGLAINAAGQTASSATAAVSVSTSTGITAAGQTASSATASVSVKQAISASGQTASSATAAVSFAQVIPITAAAQTASSAAASLGSVSFLLTASGQTASSAQAAIGSLLQATATTASSASAAFGSASFPVLASGTTASFASATMSSSAGGGGVGGDDSESPWRRWALAMGRRRVRR